MKQLSDILAELQAADKTELDNASAAIEQAASDLQNFISAQGQSTTPSTAPTADPIATVVVTTVGGVVTNLVPQVA